MYAVFISICIFFGAFIFSHVACMQSLYLYVYGSKHTFLLKKHVCNLYMHLFMVGDIHFFSNSMYAVFISICIFFEAYIFFSKNMYAVFISVCIWFEAYIFTQIACMQSLYAFVYGFKHTFFSNSMFAIFVCICILLETIFFLK
jgi:hypothetical protein